MTLSQALDYLRARFNEYSSATSYWTDAELLGLITARSQSICSILGLSENTNTSTSTVIGTQSYSWPTNATALHKVLYNGPALQEISFDDWENEKQGGGTTPSGTPTQFVPWNRTILLVPIPNAVKILTFYFESGQSVMTLSTDTWVIPEALHYETLDGVLADMSAKIPNPTMIQLYEGKWQFHMMCTFPMYRYRQRNRQRAKPIRDADTLQSTAHGVK